MSYRFYQKRFLLQIPSFIMTYYLIIIARQELYKKNAFLSPIGEEVKPQAPSPSPLWWMEQVITEEFESRSFSRGFLSRLLNRQPMNESLLTNTALLHVGWANRHHCGDRWKRNMNGQCSLLLWRISLPTDLVRGLSVWECSHPSTDPSLSPCVYESNNRRHDLKFCKV